MHRLTAFPSYELVQAVVDLAVSCLDFTQSLEKSNELPPFLANTLHLADVTLAVVNHLHDEPMQRFLICSGSSSAAASMERAAVQMQLIKCYAKSIPIAEDDDACYPRVLSSQVMMREGIQMPGDIYGTIIFEGTIDAQYRLLLAMAIGPDTHVETREIIDTMRLVVHELCKQLSCLVAWHRGCSDLGTPFNLLTREEWDVLRGLTTEASEKQLAVLLRLRPNTLHSRIKSIYSKMGVQGRLPLVLKFADAVRKYRREAHRPRLPFLVESAPPMSQGS
jgi:hypothetical protein